MDKLRDESMNGCSLMNGWWMDEHGQIMDGFCRHLLFVERFFFNLGITLKEIPPPPGKQVVYWIKLVYLHVARRIRSQRLDVSPGGIRPLELSWFDHIISGMTLIPPPRPPAAIWTPQQLFIWLYSINNTPCTRSLAHTHTRTFFKFGLIVITVRELKEGLRRKGNSLRFFHFTTRTLSFSPWSF